MHTSIHVAPQCDKSKQRKNSALFNIKKLQNLLSKCAERGYVSPPMRWLSSMIGVTTRSIQRYIKVLKSWRRLVVVYRKISATRNRPNLFKILPLQKPVAEKKKKLNTLNTNTTTRENPRVAYESRREQDKRDRQRMQLWFTERANTWAECKKWRLVQALERNKNAMRARVGMWIKPTAYDPVMADSHRKSELERSPTAMELLRKGEIWKIGKLIKV